LLALGAALLLPAGDGIAKALSATYPIVTIAWWRFAITLIAVGTTGWLRSVPLHQSGAWGWQLVRAVCALLTIIFYYRGLQSLPLAECTAIVFLAPLLAVLIARTWLTEPIRPIVWIALSLSLVGVMLIVQPGADLVKAEALWPLLAAISLGGFYAITRKLAPIDGALTTTFLTTALALIGLTMALPWFWRLPQSGLDLVLLLAVGLLGALGQHWMAMAYQRASTALVAPLGYLSAVFALFFGWLWFGEVPSDGSLIGIALILSAGVLLVRFADRAVSEPVEANSAS